MMSYEMSFRSLIICKYINDFQYIALNNDNKFGEWSHLKR